MSLKWSREHESLMGVTNGVMNVRHERESQVGITKWGHEKNKKIGGICNWDPEGSNELRKKLYKIYI